jgi:hypothetical protein
LLGKKSSFIKSLDRPERKCFENYEKYLTTVINSQREQEANKKDFEKVILNRFLTYHNISASPRDSLSSIYHYVYKLKGKKLGGMMIEEYMAVIEAESIKECDYIYKDLFSSDEALRIIQLDAEKFVDEQWKIMNPKNIEQASEIMRLSDGTKGYLWKYSLMTPLQLKINDNFKK